MSLVPLGTFTDCYLLRLQRLELLASKFDSKATKVEAWAMGKDEALANTEDIENSNLAEIMVSSNTDEGVWSPCNVV